MYTHYWRRPQEFEADRFKVWCDDVRTILANLPTHTDTAGGYHVEDPLLITYESDTNREPEVTANIVRFNGYGDLGHETFYMPRVLGLESSQSPDENGRYFDF